MEIVIYGKDDCGFCDLARNLAEQKGQKYTYKKLGVEFTMQDIANKFPAARSFPQIEVDGRYIGGYNDFKLFMMS